jgi:predicted TIM-barrel fold metal-dependent hydrolase
MIIVDNHAHIFPYLGGKSEYESRKIQLMYLQKAASINIQPVHRMDDNRIVDGQTPWTKDKPGPEGMYDVNFRIGRFGRFEWTKDNVEYWKQWMPVSLQGMVAPPEFLLAQMDYIGVDKAVLQRSHAYGKLENYYHETIRKFPDKFIGLTQVNEAKAYTDEEINELHRAIDELGLSGLYFEPRGLFVDDFKHNFDDEIFEVFWKEVDSLSIPVYVQTERAEFLDQMKRLGNILEKHPDMAFVIALGLPKSLAFEKGEAHIPQLVCRLVTEHKVFLEVAYPITVGLNSDYPYPETQPLIKYLYDAFGPEKLVWGSDIPNVERFCTYAQSLNYMKNYCDFLSDKDKELIFGKNVLRIFGL